MLNFWESCYKQAARESSLMDAIRIALIAGDDDTALSLTKNLVGLEDISNIVKRHSPLVSSPGWVYLMHREGYAHKIGCTVEPSRRHKELCNEQGETITVLYAEHVGNKDWVEEQLIQHFCHRRRDERSSREWVILDQRDVEAFPALVKKFAKQCKRRIAEAK